MNVRHIIQKGTLAVMAACALVSCDMMKEDLSDCPTGLYVNFVYDYNIQRADMLKDHVGGLTLYVYDESDGLVATKTMTEGQLSRYGSYIHFSEEELAPGHSYRLMAVGFQRSALSSSGAKYRVTGNTVGTPWQQFAIDLEHQPVTRALADYYYVDNSEPLDTLWHTLTTITTPAALHPLELAPSSLTPAKTEYTWMSDGTIKTNGQERVTVEEGKPSYATVSLIRDTNHLNVTLRALNDDPADNQVADTDYTVEIYDNNSRLDCRNNLTNPEDTLVYRPYRQWITTFVGNEQVAYEQAAHYDLMFNRLVYKNASVDGDRYAVMSLDDLAKQRNAVLIIREKSSGKIIFGLNLPYILASGRTWTERGYHYQEYLDREYDYRLQFIIRGSRVDEIQLFLGTHVHIIPWVVRNQHETLE